MIPIVRADGKAEVMLLEQIRRRSGEMDKKVSSTVQQMIDAVKEEGDRAVERYTLQFDAGLPDKMQLTQEDCAAAAQQCDPQFLKALKAAAANIRSFHEKQKQQGWSQRDSRGCLMGQKVRGMHRVGVYVPGGTAAYPSTVLMNTIPARIAGVQEIVMVTPPPKAGLNNNEILAAAWIAGVDRVFQIGGAQAVAALAFGTQTVPRVDKIVGPGNIYVATAKRLLYGVVDIDMIAGPSEILILADESADPSYLAADLMSQAEHDVMASAILLTTSEEIAQKVQEELKRQSAQLSRRNIIEQSLRDYGAIIVLQDLAQAVELANELAPEHLEVMTKDPESLLDSIQNAGSIFLGAYSPEPLGDYYAGPNHVLPTSGTARFFSPLSVDSFLKKSSFISYTKQALREARNDIVLLAQTEGLTAHANAVIVRDSDGI